MSETAWRSNRFPSGEAPALLFGSDLVRPLAFCMIPVMLATVAAMLMGRYVLQALYFAAPVAVAVASWWTHQRLRTECVEISVDRDMVSLRSRWDVSKNRAPTIGARVLDVRRENGDLDVTVGLATHRLRAADWPQLADIERHVREAKKAGIEIVHRRLEA